MAQSGVSSSLTSGTRVRIVDSEPGAADPKALVYYDFYRNLTGTVTKAYDDGSIALSVDRRSLPPEVRQRHEETERVLRDKWLGGLSEEDRNKLTQKEQRFSLRYMLLVAGKHVVPDSSDGGSSKPRSAAVPVQTEPLPEAPPARPSTSDLDAAEERYLNSKQNP